MKIPTPKVGGSSRRSRGYLIDGAVGVVGVVGNVEGAVGNVKGSWE